MSTRATDTVRNLAAAWKALYPSAVISGIVGDTSHAQRGGYHISIQDQVNPANYSVVRPDDKAPPGTWPRDCAAAIDVNLALDDMKRCHGRLVAVWRNRAADPRARYINAHNGWNGEGAAGRYDWYAGTVSSATDDHKWHIHLEIRRRYVNDPKAAAAVLSILRGESLASYLGDDDMTPEEHTWLKAVHTALTRLDGREPIGQSYLRLAVGQDDTEGAKPVEHPSLKSLGGQLTAMQAALLGAVEGLDTQQILDRIDQVAAAETARDAELAELARAGQSGELDADEVLRRMGEMLTAGTAPQS